MSKHLKWWIGFGLTAIPITLIYAALVGTMLIHLDRTQWLTLGVTAGVVAALIAGCLLMSNNHS